jgi:parallel beta-helix repeat protein
MKRLLLIIVITFFWFTEAWCATYYIDFSNGLDTHNGISTAAPFKHCPGDKNATDKAASTTLAGGDRVIFKGGVVYSTSANYGIILTWSGNADADAGRIIYDGDSGIHATRWASGTDKAIIDGGGVTDMGLFTVIGAGKQYITINNFVLRNGNDVAYGSDYFAGLVVGYAAATNITVSNCDLSDAGHDTYDANRSGYGILGSGANWVIHDNTITDCYLGGINVTGSNTKVYNNTFTGKLRWTLTYANTGNTEMTGAEIYNNTFHDCGKGDSGSASYHQDWLYVFSTGAGGIDNIKIYNNKFYNDYSPAEEFGAGFIYLGPQDGGVGGGVWDGVYIYNNVMFNGATASPVFMTFTMKEKGKINDLYIYNNSCYSASASGGSAINLGWSAGWNKYTNVRIKNNIFARPGNFYMLSIPPAAGMDGTVDIDYNFYYTTKTDPFGLPGACDDGYCTFAQWQGLGYDTHGMGPTTDPKFVSTTPARFDLSLQGTSPCIGKGANLGSPYNFGIAGNTRSASGAWDIGAYKFTLQQALLPPLNLRIH